MRYKLISGFAGAVFSVAASGLALAADIAVKAPPPAPVPVYSWTGFYVGGNVGGHWGFDRLSTVTTDPTGFFGPGGAGAIDSFSRTTLRPEGFTGGLQAGYNWQFSPFLVGIEGDFNWLSGSDSRTLTGIPIVAPGDIETNSDRANWLATVRARLGTVFIDRALLYVTGGVAFARIKTTDVFGAAGNTDISGVTTSTTRTGWTVGGGVEYAFANNWSWKVEYLFVDLGNFSATAPPFATGGGAFITYNHNYTENIARAGLNYQFH